MGNKFFDNIHKNPIIAAVRDMSKLDDAINSPSVNIFLLTGNIFNLEEVVQKAKSKGKNIYIHIDLMDGIAKDVYGLRFIIERVKPDGIISTKSNLIKYTKDMKTFAIQRLFILDSLSLESGIKSIKDSKPDAVEILPGVMPKSVKMIYTQTRIPVITGGLIMDKEDVIESLKAGATGISSSNEKIWYT